jgi:hydroxymethylpyrimidine/phosphomethylpyrimidine kinase
MKNIFLLLQFLFLENVTSFLQPNFKEARILMGNQRSYSPFGRKYYEEYIRNLNSRNITIQNENILNNDSDSDSEDFFEKQDEKTFDDLMNSIFNEENDEENETKDNSTSGFVDKS